LTFTVESIFLELRSQEAGFRKDTKCRGRYAMMGQMESKNPEAKLSWE
jgi:hypothetical protein